METAAEGEKPLSAATAAAAGREGSLPRRGREGAPGVTSRTRDDVTAVTYE